MHLYQVVILALIQALTEFLPVSSSAHLELAPWLFGWKDPGLTFDIALHAGTLLAVLIYFFRDWVQIIAQGFGFQAGRDPELRHNSRLLWLLAIASIPVGIAGVLFSRQAEGSWRNPYLIGTMLIAVGIVMWIADRRAISSEDELDDRRGPAVPEGGVAVASRTVTARSIGEVTAADAIAIGVSQALAVVPGTSRSGITITTGLFRGLTREAAARFSFLLSTPAIAAAAAKGLWDIHKHGGIAPEMRIPFALGVIVSGVAGAVVIAYFLKYLRSHSLMPFVLYRIIFGIIVVALAVFFRYSAG